MYEGGDRIDMLGMMNAVLELQQEILKLKGEQNDHSKG